MDLRSLRYFNQVADSRSFSKAALHLHVGQPALSRCIRLLEDELEVKLLRRSNRGVEITQAGQLLRRRSQDMLDQFNRLRDEVRAQADEITGSATLGVPSAIGQVIVPAILRHLRQLHPGIRLQIVEGISAETYEKLLAQSIQIGLLYDPLPHRDLVSEPIAMEDIYLVGRKDVIRKLGLTGNLADLENVPMILPKSPNSRRLLVESAFKERGLILNVVAEVDGFATTRALLAEGAGFSFMTHSSLADLDESGLLKAVGLRSESISWQLSLVGHRSQSENQVIQVVSEAVCAVAVELMRNGRWKGCRPVPAPAHVPELAAEAEPVA